MQRQISVTEARAIILDAVRVLSFESIPLATARGRILAQTIVAKENVPPFDNAAVDGFVLCQADLEAKRTQYQVVGQLGAGAIWETSIAPGTCLQIMTGAPVPPNAAGVAMVEWSKRKSETEVELTKHPSLGQHIRLAGSDVAEGQEVLQPKKHLSPFDLGMMAALGYAEVFVFKKPKVAILTTGNEIIPIDAPLKAGKIRNANSTALVAQVEAAGGEVVWCGHAQDDKLDTQKALAQAQSADMVLVSGGVSMGEYDYVRVVLEEMGWEPRFWQIKQRPGKPMAFGHLGQALVFGLPGNPVSSSLCFDQYVRPALQKMSGASTWIRPSLKAILIEEMVKVGGLHFFARGLAHFGEDGRLRVRSAGGQGSHMYAALAQANCLIHLPETWTEAKAGTEVEITGLDAGLTLL